MKMNKKYKYELYELLIIDLNINNKIHLSNIINYF